MESLFALFIITVTANIVGGLILIIIQHAFEKDGENDKE